MPSNSNKTSKLSRPKIVVATVASLLAAGGAATAIAAPSPEGDSVVPIEQHASSADRAEYQRVYREAERYDVAPKRNLAEVAPGSPELGARADVLRIDVVGERGKRNLREALAPKFDSPESLGVSQATLDSIAACESGGDPTVVDASGTYYGKYQFDLQTWAAQGGSGSPADAPEEEQDYRAALLYSQAGSSPWPNCG